MLRFAIFVLLAQLKHASACVDDQCRELEFPGSYFFHGERLINHVIRTIKVLDQDSCEFQCYLEHNCVSINFEFTGTHICDLNNSTHKEHEKDLVKAESYVYHGTNNACGKAPCQNNATCQTGFTRKRYRCLCKSGFTGNNCEHDIDECKGKTNKCDVNAVCNNTKGSYVCTCKDGYTGDGQNCEDIDECAQDTHNCSKVGGLCNNTEGSFNCSCKPGYTGDGHNCTDIDECVENIHICNNATALCRNSNGSYICICKPGYTGDGNNCTDIDECAQDTHDCSKDGGLCNNTVGSFNCTCKPGFIGDGHNCAVFTINSTIISNNQYYLHHLYRFLAPAVGNTSQWLLCYRQSLHGDLDSTFHEKCDGKRNTVTIVRVKEFVFGGYTDIPWESNDTDTDYKWYGSTSKAFIFSLHNNENLGPFKSMVTNSKEAIYFKRYYGPTFGTRDIHIDRHGNSKTNTSTTNLGNDYDVPNNIQDSETVLAGVHKFHPDEVEVFYLKVT
ncbi:uncharacterized protein LOC144665245 isoform X2 [Oculina patagonica]